MVGLGRESWWVETVSSLVVGKGVVLEWTGSDANHNTLTIAYMLAAICPNTSPSFKLPTKLVTTRCDLPVSALTSAKIGIVDARDEIHSTSALGSRAADDEGAGIGLKSARSSYN